MLLEMPDCFASEVHISDLLKQPQRNQEAILLFSKIFNEKQPNPNS